VVAFQAQEYHRSPLEPLLAERISHRRLCLSPVFVSSVFVACLQDSAVPLGQGDPEVLRHPRHVCLLVGLEVLPQLGAVAVNLVPAVEIGPDLVHGRGRADVDGQLALGAERQVHR